MDSPNFTLGNYPNLSIDNNSDFEGWENYCPSVNVPVVIFAIRIIYGIICFLGLLGNTLVIYVVLRYSKMQTVTNMYILNLAIADECFLIGIPFLIVTMTLQYWPFGSTMCKIYMISTGINQFTSSIFLCIMSADRYIAVCHPITAPRFRTPFISRIVSAAAWTASAIVMLPIFLYTTVLESNKGQTSCNIAWPETDSLEGQRIFILYSFVLGFAAPLTLIFIFYFLVIKKLRTVGPKCKSKDKKRSHRKVTKLVLTIITVYVFCWLPYWGFQMSLIFSSDDSCTHHISITVFLFVYSFSYSNSAINPILYAFLSDNFKKSFLKACSCYSSRFINTQYTPDFSIFPGKRKLTTERKRLAEANNRLTLSLPANSKSEASPIEYRSDLPSDNAANMLALPHDCSDLAVSTIL